MKLIRLIEATLQKPISITPDPVPEEGTIGSGTWKHDRQDDFELETVEVKDAIKDTVDLPGGADIAVFDEAGREIDLTSEECPDSGRWAVYED